jgi:hypothetical protein
MFAAVILVFIAIGGAAFMIHSRVTIVDQGRKRVAIELANRRLEEIRAMPVNGLGGITNLVPAAGAHSLSRTGGGWQVDAAPYENVTLDGVTYRLETTVEYIDTYMLELQATVLMPDGAAYPAKDAVSVRTYYVPDVQYYP